MDLGNIARPIGPKMVQNAALKILRPPPVPGAKAVENKYPRTVIYGVGAIAGATAHPHHRHGEALQTFELYYQTEDPIDPQDELAKLCLAPVDR
jgi:hypothetical protein